MGQASEMKGTGEQEEEFVKQELKTGQLNFWGK